MKSVMTCRAAVRMLRPWKWRPPVEGEAGRTPGVELVELVGLGLSHLRKRRCCRSVGRP